MQLAIAGAKLWQPRRKEKADKYGKEETRANKEIVEARIDRINELISLCTPTGEMIRIVKEEWGLGTGSAEQYIRKARAKIRERWNEQSRQDWVATALNRMDKVAQMSMKSGQQSNDIGATNLQARLLGITGRDN